MASLHNSMFKLSKKLSLVLICKNYMNCWLLQHVHSCPEALLRIKKITRTETYTGSLYDTWGVLKIFFKTFQLGNFEKSTNLCFPYAKLGAKMEENGHF